MRRCFQADPLATGRELDISAESARYSQFRNDREMLDLFVANGRGLGRAYGDPGPAGRMNRASTDMSNVSLRIPAINPYLSIASLPVINHQREFAIHCVSAAVGQAVLDGAAAVAPDHHQRREHRAGARQAPSDLAARVAQPRRPGPAPRPGCPLP